MRHKLSAFAFVTIAFLGACSSKYNTLPVQSCTGSSCTTVVNTIPLGCTVTAAGNIAGGTAATLNISALGGTAPYSTTGVSSFTSTASIQKTYPGSTQFQVVKDSLTITDSAGASKACEFTVNVFPPGTTNLNGIACSLNIAGGSSANPKVGQTVNFEMMAIGGSGNFQFEFDPKDGYHFFRGTYAAGVMATAQGTYNGAGIVSPMLSVRDSNYQYTSCSQTVTVRNAPTLQVAASPSTTAAVGSTITLTATATDFLNSSTSYSFSSSDSNVVVTASGNTATVHPNDSLYHKARITVRASNNGDTAEKYIDVEFASLGLSCNVELQTTGNIYTGDEVSFNVATNNGAAEIISFDPGYGGSVVSGQGAIPVRVRYTTGGAKTVRVMARHGASDTPCNNGVELSQSVTVRSPVACTASAPAQSQNGQPITISASIPTGYGYTGNNIRIIEVRSSAGSNFEVTQSPASLSWIGRFGNNGDETFPLYVKVKDFDDPQTRTADCPVIYHRSIVRNPVCSVNFTDPNGVAISSARAHDVVRVRTGNLNGVAAGYERLVLSHAVDNAPPAGFVAVGFPNITNGFRFTRNLGGPVSALAEVRADGNSPVQTCSAGLTLTDSLACNFAKPTRVGSQNTWTHAATTSETGYRGLNIGDYAGDAWTPAVADVTMRAFNKAGNVTYTYDGHGTEPVLQNISANTSQTFRSVYPTNGVYPISGTVVDSYDPIGNSCRDDDAQRLVVDTAQRIVFTRPTAPNNYNYWYNYFNRCAIKLTNGVNRPNQILVNGALHGFAPNETRSIVILSGSNSLTCEVSLATAGDRNPSGWAIADGPQRWDAQLEVDYHAYAPNWSRPQVIATYQLHSM